MIIITRHDNSVAPNLTCTFILWLFSRSSKQERQRFLPLNYTHNYKLIMLCLENYVVTLSSKNVTIYVTNHVLLLLFRPWSLLTAPSTLLWSPQPSTRPASPSSSWRPPTFWTRVIIITIQSFSKVIIIMTKYLSYNFDNF